MKREVESTSSNNKTHASIDEHMVEDSDVEEWRHTIICIHEMCPRTSWVTLRWLYGNVAVFAILATSYYFNLVESIDYAWAISNWIKPIDATFGNMWIWVIFLEVSRLFLRINECNWQNLVKSPFGRRHQYDLINSRSCFGKSFMIYSKMQI